MPVTPLAVGQELCEEPRGFRYVITQVLNAEGGFGITYRATDRWFEGTSLSANVVIKELACEAWVHRAAGSPRIVVNSDAYEDAVNRLTHEFFREARLIMRFRNRHLVHVLDAWSQNGTAYYAMLELEGASPLGTTPFAGGPAPTLQAWDEVEPLARQVLEALDVIHRGNVFHLDIKPENILRCPDGRVVLIDFGTARRRTQIATVPTRLSGMSPFYAPPEIFEPFEAAMNAPGGPAVPFPAPHAIGAWSDLFSWAMVVYGMLRPHPTLYPWRRFHGGPNPYETASADLQDAGVPEEWAQTLRQCLAIDVGERQVAVATVSHVRALLRTRLGQRVGSLPAWARELEDVPEIVVSADGTGDFRTIAEAVAAAPPKGRISIRPGVYGEALRIEKKALLIEGRDSTGQFARDDVIIESSDKTCIEARAPIFLRSLTIKARAEDRAYVVEAYAPALLDNCRVRAEGDVSAVWLWNEGALVACEIEAESGGGIYASRSTAIERSTVVASHGIVTPSGARLIARDVSIKAHVLGLRIYGVVDFEHGEVLSKRVFTADRKSQTSLRDCNLRGVHPSETEGHLVMAECHVRGGLVVRPKGEAVVRHSGFRESKGHAIWVEGAAVVESCDLRGNGHPGIGVPPGSKLTASDNVE